MPWLQHESQDLTDVLKQNLLELSVLQFLQTEEHFLKNVHSEMTEP